MKPAYKLARAGKEAELKPTTITIHELKLMKRIQTRKNRCTLNSRIKRNRHWYFSAGMKKAKYSGVILKN